MNLATFADELAAVGETLAKANFQPPRLYELHEGPPSARSVDCGACTACCHLAVYLLPWDDATQYETEADGMLLKRSPNGSCVYLGDHGCTIYDSGPTEQMPGVIAVLTGGDAEGDGLQPIPHRPVPANPHEVPLKSRLSP